MAAHSAEINRKLKSLGGYIEDVYETEDRYGDLNGDYYLRSLDVIRTEFDKEIDPRIQKAHITGMALDRFKSCMNLANSSLLHPIAIYRAHQCAAKLQDQLAKIDSVYSDV